MKTTCDVLIAGGGIAGLLLARQLRARGRSVVVADDPADGGAWSAAVGLLNPLRGRRHALAWRAAEVFAAARAAYASIPATTPLLREVAIVRPFADEEERTAGLARIGALLREGFSAEGLADLPAGFKRPALGGLRIEGGATVATRETVAALRGELLAAGAFLAEPCRPEALRWTGASATWSHGAGSVSAGRLVLAGGIADRSLPWLEGVPLRPLPGGSLTLEAPGLDPSLALAGRRHLAPRPGGGWSCGGGSEADGGDPESFLREHLAVPWRVTGRHSGVRAMPPDSRPIAGPSPVDPRVLLLNGLGAHGFACAPWLAGVLADLLVDDRPPPADVATARFRIRSVDARWHAVERAHTEAARRLRPGDFSVDLTAGNGGDALFLARAVGPEGRVFAVDLQAAAIESSARRLREAGMADRVDLRCSDHAGLAALLPEGMRGRLAVVLANLGYLPGSASPITTRRESTVAACATAVAHLAEGGALVVVVYTAHPGGLEEREALERWVAGLDPLGLRVSWERHPGGARRAPSLLVVERPGPDPA